MFYKVYFTYSPRYNPDGAKSDYVFWQWSEKPVTWEDYEPVRRHIEEGFNARHVMLYAVVPATVVTETMTPASFLRGSYNKKTKLYEPWRIDDHLNRRAS